MKWKLAFLSVLIFVFSCSKKAQPYYMFNVSKDIIVTDSIGKVLRDTFYRRVNLGYSYEIVKGIDTVIVPKYVTIMDLRRGLKIKMFAGIASIDVKSLKLIMDYSPSRLTYVKSNFQSIPEGLIEIYKTKNTYLIFTSLNIYRIDAKGKEEKVLDVYTTKRFYIRDVYRINPNKFVLIDDDKFAFYLVKNDSLIINTPKSQSPTTFIVNNSICRLESIIFGPNNAKYRISKYDYNGDLIESKEVPEFNNQYRFRVYVSHNNPYILTEKGIYRLNPVDFSVVKKLYLPTGYDSLWDVGSDFVVYSKKERQIAKITKDLSHVHVLAKDIDCQGIYTTSSLIVCTKKDSTFLYDLSFKPVSVYKNALFVKGDFVCVRENDTLLFFQKGDTFLKIPSPYYSYQKKLMEEGKNKE